MCKGFHHWGPCKGYISQMGEAFSKVFFKGLIGYVGVEGEEVVA
jgi:hypothetical protein